MSWEPQLTMSEVGGRCRLVLGGRLHGDGDSLQEAGDALVARTRHVGIGLRSGRGTVFTTELLRPNREFLDFLHLVGDAAANGHDVRQLVFGIERRAA
jgi:hypothetical protein